MTRATKPHSKPSGRRLVFSFFASRQGVAALEFALVLPVMLAVTLGSVEVARLMTFSRRVNLVASTAVQMLTQSATGTVNYIDVNFAQQSAMVIFPQVLLDSSQKGINWANDIQISVASIKFTANNNPICSGAACYDENVVWYAGANPRPCGKNKIAAIADNTTPSPTTLPQDVYAAGSIIAVDVNFTYTPLFTGKLFGSVSMKRSAYVAPRNVALITYSTISGDPGVGTVCP